MRLGSANTFERSLDNLTTRQADLASLQEKLTAGKRVVRPSDDPSAAAQAERALTRLTRIDVEQRALAAQKNSLTLTENTLGESVNVLQSIRDLVVNAGNPSLNNSDRASMASQLQGLRDQLLSYANQKDTNGVPMFGGLGSTSVPFVDSATGVTYNGTSGQRVSTSASVPTGLDGQAVWMDVPSGNGIFKVDPNSANTGAIWTDMGQVTSPSALTGHNYEIQFTVAAGVTTYDVVDTTLGATVLAGQPYAAGRDIQFDGMSMKVNGTPANGDKVDVTPSTRVDLFSVLDNAIAGIKQNNGAPLNQTVALALAQIDTGTDRLQSARGMAGDLLNRADIIDNNQQGKSINLTADKSRAEDMDLTKGISDFQNQQTAYDAALKTYAQVQRLSLFNYLS